MYFNYLKFLLTISYYIIYNFCASFLFPKVIYILIYFIIEYITIDYCNVNLHKEFILYKILFILMYIYIYD
jgi:hypothetical protein